MTITDPTDIKITTTSNNMIAKTNMAAKSNIAVNNTSSNGNNLPAKKPKQNKKPRCSHSLCKVRLTMIDLGIECKCGLPFCGRHRLPECHNCSYDHKGEAQEIIAKKINESACITEKIIHV